MAGRGRYVDLVNRKFGNWTVVERVGTVGAFGNRHATWTCRCCCGAIRILKSNQVKSNKPESCGCMRGTHRHTAGNDNRKSPTYSSWSSMVSRCTRPSNPAFQHYQSRGISICNRWRSGEGGLSGFECFLQDIGERPGKEYTLDRWPDNHGNYEPSNVRWATKREQANNRVTNRVFTYEGTQFTLADLSRHTGISKEVLRSRLIRSNKWTVEGAVKTPLQRGKKQDFYF